jgi:segregation and condensation protein B
MRAYPRALPRRDRSIRGPDPRSAPAPKFVRLQPGTQAANRPAESEREEDKLRRLEAVLFLAREPLNSRRLSEFARLADGTQARTLIRRLNRRYDEARRPYQIRQVAEGFQLLTRPQFASWLRRLGRRAESTGNLSAPTLETLAVVAYRQPILKAEIESIRGVGCSEVLRQLMDRDLVRIAGRSHELGRPFLYATTKNFLRTFGLSGLDALPRADQLRGMGLPNWALPSQNQDSSTTDPSALVGLSEESNVRLSSSSQSIEELSDELGAALAAPHATSALEIRNADEEEEEFADDGLEDDDEDDEDDEEEWEDDEEDDGDWEEIDDDEDWDDEEEEDEDDEDWEDDDEEDWE